ncbi:MAG: SPW repeat protein [bacterium]|nr:SPW repeat protein [bacterium]
MWRHWINGLLGLWLIVSPFVFETSSSLMNNIIVVGIVVAVLGFWGAGVEKHSMSEESHA